MDVRLVVDKGSTKQRTWELHHKETVIGRRRDCDLRILSAEVSRRHCVLIIDDGYVNLEDLDSINGTFINGSRVVGKQVVRPGDHLEIGPLEFIVEYELSRSVQERLAQQGLQEEQELEVLPMADEASDEHEVYDVLPVAEEASASTPAQREQDEEEGLAVLDEDAADWHIPPTNELRDLLSQMEQPG